MIFLFKQVIFRFHVSFRGSRFLGLGHNACDEWWFSWHLPRNDLRFVLILGKFADWNFSVRFFEIVGIIAGYQIKYLTSRCLDMFWVRAESEVPKILHERKPGNFLAVSLNFQHITKNNNMWQFLPNDAWYFQFVGHHNDPILHGSQRGKHQFFSGQSFFNYTPEI